MDEIKSGDWALYNQALEAFESARYDDCALKMRCVAARNPRAADPQYYLGMVAVKRNEKASIIRRYFAQLSRLSPDYNQPLAQYYMGLVAYTDSAYTQAVKHLDRYFELVRSQDSKENLSVYDSAVEYLRWSQFLSEASRTTGRTEPVLMHQVSTSADELFPFLTTDGQQLFFLRLTNDIAPGSYYRDLNAAPTPHLMMSRKRGNTFGEAQEIAAISAYDKASGTTLSAGSHFSLTADNCTIYHVRNRLSTSGSVQSSDIYYSVLSGEHWSAPIHAGTNVNGTNSIELDPAVSADGRTLYFASNRRGGQGGFDIWCCHQLPNGDWSRAENAGPSVNSSADDVAPFLHADGRTLYLASNGRMGFGGFDTYYIYVNNTFLQQPVNLGAPFSTEGQDLGVCVAASGEEVLLSRRAKQGVGGSDLWRAVLRSTSAPQPMACRRGIVTDTSHHPIEGSLAVMGSSTYTWQSTLADGGMYAAVYPTTDTEQYVAVVMSPDHMPQFFRPTSAADTLLLPPATEGGKQRVAIAWSSLWQAGHGITPTGRAWLNALRTWLLNTPSQTILLEIPTGEEDVARALKKLNLRQGRIELRANSALSQARITLTHK